jgi:osmotically-inducible protein OsmY
MNTTKHSTAMATLFASLLLAAPLQANDRDIGDELNEARLEGQIWATMAVNRHLSPFGIDIDVDGSTATLKGEVEESVQRDLAEEIALGMSGIDRVDNQIDVVSDVRERQDDSGERGFGDRVSDATTTATVRSKLLWNRNTQGLSISVSTEDGHVTLDGEADSEAGRELAERLAANTDGVDSVDNRIRVTADAGSNGNERGVGDAVSDTWVTTKVRSTLIFSTDVPSRHISVETRDGVVHLDGEVETERERDRAIALAADVEGVVRVNADGLEVVGS